MRPALEGASVMSQPRLGLAILLAVTAGALASCHRPSTKSQEAAAPTAPVPVGVERAGPARWNATTGGFELDGKPVKTAKLWTFDGSTDGFSTTTSKIAPAAGQGLMVNIADPILRSPKGLNVPGNRYNLVLIRLTRVAPGGLWDGALYYATPAHGEESGYFGKPLAGADPKVGETTTLVYDMAHQRRGEPDWMQSTIDEIRLDIDDKPGGAFVIRQIAIGEDPEPEVMAAMAPPPKGKPGAVPAGDGAAGPPAKP